VLITYNLQFFAKDGPGGEKTEQPTSKRKQDSRKDGSVAKSEEVANALILLALFLIVRFYVGTMGTGLLDFIKVTYTKIPDYIMMDDGRLPGLTIRGLFINGLLRVVIVVGPLMLIAFAVAVISNLIQFKWMITTKPLRPKLSKLNPIKGFKKIISMDSLVKLLKSLIKIFIIGYIAYSYLVGRLDEIYLFYDLEFNQVLMVMSDIIFVVGMRIVGAYILLALADFSYQKWKHHRDLMMTKQEVKDEFKNQEGDPQIKAQQRKRMAAASMRRMMSALPEADVVITNPTHYAVALKYDADKYDAPIVLAKGIDFLALRIKDIAKEHGVEIVENKPLARMLYTNVEIGEMVPPELYQAVAEVLAMVYQMRESA
jgi:flagellar biosynthetic protein FlhB